MHRFAPLLCVALALGACASAQTPIAINGVDDRATYTDSVSFSVPVLPGYSCTVELDGERAPAVVTNVVDDVDYHELTVWRTNTSNGNLTERTVRFIVTSSRRGNPEKGLIVWTPYPPVPSTAAEFAGAQFHLAAPQDFPLGLDIPIAAWVDDGHDRIIRGNGWVTAAGFESSAFRLVRGHGSGFLPAAASGTAVEYNAALTTLTASRRIQIDSNTAWSDVSGTLAGDVTWLANSRIAVVADLTIPSGVTLTIEAGAVVRINPLVNIINNGSLVINGSMAQPVVLTSTTRPAPERHTGAWGGIIMRGGTLLANHAFLTGAGGASSFNFSPSASHRSEQPLLLIHSGSSAILTNCYLLNQAGQILNGYNSTITFDHCLLQRAITVGESVGCTILVNHSALIEFPSIDGAYDAGIANADYDAIYFTTGTHTLKDSLIGFAKDDAIDSGSGGAGTVLVTNCWLESALHEALAWSGADRQTWTRNSVLINCGQGIEAGWTEGGSQGSPNCFADHLLSTANSVGARFGDNYDWTYYGFLRITNSILIHNYRDIFAKTWNTSGSSWNTNQWVDRLDQIDLRDNLLTAADSRFPTNFVWEPDAHSSLLQAFMSTPPAAPVGVGFAVWTNQFSLPAIFDGVPVRLSSFTTHPVDVVYTFTGPNGELARGSLSFAPGETVRRIFPTGFDLRDQNPLRVALVDAQGGTVTGLNEVLFSGSIAEPVASFAVAEAQLGMERIGEGVPVRLSVPAAHLVSVQYRFRASPDHQLTGGTLNFSPGEVLKWIEPPPAGPQGRDMVRLDMFSPVGATISGPTNLLFVATGALPPPESVALLRRGAQWRYLDDGSNQGTAWREPAFLDGTWASGAAQLGFGDEDEATPIRRTNTANGTTNITFYFRSTFVITNLSTYTNLSMWLLRDDGAVVYLNGREVFRSVNMPGGTIFYTTFATSTGENSIDTATLSITNLVEGSNVAAVEMHQRDLTSSDISFDFELIANPTPPVATVQELRAGLFDGLLFLGWGDSSYVLEEAGTLTGPWTQVNDPSPVSRAVTDGQRFFRLRR